MTDVDNTAGRPMPRPALQRSSPQRLSHTPHPPGPVGTHDGAPEPRPRFLSEADCRALLEQVKRLTTGGGSTTLQIHSTWTGNVRWARNQVISSGDVRTNTVKITRVVNGAINTDMLSNDTSEAGLLAAVRRAERLAKTNVEKPNSDLVTRFPVEQPLAPKLFSEATYQLDADKREAAAVELSKAASAAGMLSAGYIEVSAHSLATLDTYGRMWYFPYTQAQYSVTVRDPKGTGSGWAGVDHADWAKIDGPKLSQIALDKCLQSRDAVKIEPGKYTVILEPQAVGDFIHPVVDYLFDRQVAENSANHHPFFKDEETVAALGGRQVSFTKLGEQVIDKRLSMGADPMDLELGFPPFSLMPQYPPVGGWALLQQFDLPVYHPVQWIEQGVLTHLAYDRRYALGALGRDTGLPNPGAFRMGVTGPTQSIAEMIAATARGLLVTRFDQVKLVGEVSTLCYGHTRDGLWLIEHGKISKPVKNMYFTESVLAALNRVEAIGVPQRIFHPLVPSFLPFNPQPVVVPPLKLRDFSFTALDDAV